MPRSRTIHTVLAAILLSALGACRPGDELTTTAEPPLILISIDTLRSDRLPAYGYEGVETPAIDDLRADGILFERAFSHMPLTLPSHSSMLTGLLPPEHGVRDNMGYTLESAGLPFAPRLLRESGYATGAAVSTFVLRSDVGLAEGFDFFDDEMPFDSAAAPDSGEGLVAGSGGLQRRGSDTLDSALGWVRQVKDGPFFLFFHLYEPHLPWDPPEPWASRYADAYDAEIATADEVVGRLLAELRALGLYDDAAIVLVSDHGEGLDDHGEREHGIFLYRESLQVPLVLKLPGNLRAGETISTPAQLVDVMPTLLELAGVERPAEITGSSLIDLVRGEVPDRRHYSETHTPRLYFGWSELVSLQDERYQYIQSPEPELYDLVADPGQRVNVFERERREAGRLRQEILAMDVEFDEPYQVDEETRGRLEALGYIGGATSRYAGDLPAPHTQIHLLGELKAAHRAAEAGRHEEAVSAVESILAENPQMILAWGQKARSLKALGRLRESLDAYEETLRLSDSAPHTALQAARVAATLGKVEDARELAGRAVTWNPVAAHVLLGQIALTSGDLAVAAEEADRAVAVDPKHPPALVLQAHISLLRGDPEGALESLGRAESAAAAEPVRGLHLMRGNALGQLGRLEEAEREFLEETGLFPGDARAYGRLAMLYAGTGRPDEAVEVLRGLVDRSPSPGAYGMAVMTLRTSGMPEAAASFLREGLERFPENPRLRSMARG